MTLVSDFVDCINVGVMQRTGTIRLGTPAIVHFINLALMDIYTYKGKNWSFAFHSHTITEEGENETDAYVQRVI